jgi:hypothetical protein
VASVAPYCLGAPPPSRTPRGYPRDPVDAAPTGLPASREVSLHRLWCHFRWKSCDSPPSNPAMSGRSFDWDNSTVESAVNGEQSVPWLLLISREIHAKPRAVLNSGIPRAAGRHLAQYNLRSHADRAIGERADWVPPVHFGRRHRRSHRAIDDHRQSVACGMPTAPTAGPATSPSSVARLNSRSDRASSDLGQCDSSFQRHALAMPLGERVLRLEIGLTAG